MPTQHVEPSSSELLHDVANALLKARKVVVVTGAGISTNSGIPDFRSENGLYSLIQAQFDAAARQPPPEEASTQASSSDGTESESENEDGPPPSKRRRISRDNTVEPEEAVEKIEENIEDEIQVRGPVALEAKNEIQIDPDTIVVGQAMTERVEIYDSEDTITVRTGPATTAFATPQRRRGLAAAEPTTSPLSSPPPEDASLPPSAFRTIARHRLAEVAIPLSSSPLSSPPSAFSELFMPSSPFDASGSGRRSSTSPSEVDDTPPSQSLFTSSQTSNSARNSLPNMKGKDLFDASIWSDPLRTSVFYTFATSLRQKIRDVKPTTSHHFISHLRDRGKLVRCYTQNIDQIEEKVGLSTSLTDGPGSRGRFSRRSTANTSQLSKMVEQVSGDGTDSNASEKTSQSDPEPSQQSQCTPSDETGTPGEGATQPKPPQRSGVECVFLHGSLDLLRCFLCGRVCKWDELELETLSGQQPECPHCVGATVAREEKGKRALGVGKLRPDIVLYGEEHPNAHLISPIVTHDLTLYPDMLLILGTSLRVHGLKVMVREFAKAVHSKGGKVVFVNFTKPPESSWGDVIDYWVEWDCDAWVQDLQEKIPKLWQAPEPPRPKKKKELAGSDDGDKPEVKKPPPANPAAIRDTKVTGAYWTSKIMGDLYRITGNTPPARRASIAAAPPAPAPIDSPTPTSAAINTVKAKARSKRPRKSAPGALEQPKKPSTLNPNHGRSRRQTATKPVAVEQPHPRDMQNSINSILNSVKDNPRTRRRKKIDGEDVVLPTVGKKRSAQQLKPAMSELTLPALSPQMNESTPLFSKPEPMEPNSPPQGPLSSISANLRSAVAFGPPLAFYFDDPLLHSMDKTPRWVLRDRRAQPPGRPSAEMNAGLALAGLSQASPVAKPVQPQPGGFEGQLMNWGSTWSCNK